MHVVKKGSWLKKYMWKLEAIPYSLLLKLRLFQRLFDIRERTLTLA